MPHHGYYGWDWEELPESAQKAAKLMGYTQTTWDHDEKVAYHEKPFDKLTLDEKRAATYLGRTPLDFKLNGIQWDKLDSTTQKHATTLGWDQNKWDKSWALRDLDVDEEWWGDMSTEQKEAATFFGYNQNLWDEEEEEEDFSGSAPSVGKTDASKPSGSTEEKKEDGADKPTKKKVPFTQTELFGGSGGTAFDHGNHMHIEEITVSADGKVVHGIEVHYRGKTASVGKLGMLNSKSVKLRPGEFIVAATVRTDKKLVLSLTLVTNRGGRLGPFGTSDKGEEFKVKAPEGAVLVGLVGRAGSMLDAIGFKWGPSPKA